MHPRSALRLLPLLAASAALAACSDGANPVGAAVPTADAAPPGLMVAVTCSVSIEARAVRCGESGSPDGTSRLIVGGQDVYVTLASSSIAVAADTFAMDVTVTSLIPQPLGTADGVTIDPAGVRVFFSEEPASAEGAVAVANPDGAAIFTAPAQPYYQYDGPLFEDETSAAKRWKFTYDPAVTSFTFTVLVSAAVQFPDGYIDGHFYVLTLDPNEARALPATVRSAVGTALGDAIDWVSNAPSTASVSGTQVTAGPSNGFASLTPASGPRPGLYPTTVSVCQSAVVGNGTSLPSSISSADCFSSYGSNEGLPTTSYYADLFRVSLTAGQTLTVTMDSGDDLDTYLLLAGPSFGELVAGNDDDDEGLLGVGSRMVYTATETGVYVIEASTFNGLDTGDYTLGVTIS